MYRKFILCLFVCILFGVSCLAQAITISYPTPNKFIFGAAIQTLSPTTSGAIEKYGVSPNLPDGLNLDTSKGTITGTPNEILKDSVYTVTAFMVAAKDKSRSTATFKLVIRVQPCAQTPSRHDQCFAIASIAFLCLLLIIFLFVAAFFQSKKNGNEALGLPKGSVRAIIAILFIVFFMLLAVIFYFDENMNTHNADLAKQILTILGTLVTAVSAFYFGSKATEQGHTIAMDAFKSFQNDNANQTGQSGKSGNPPTPGGEEQPTA